MSEQEEIKKNKAEFLLSTDSLSWYWLDLIFETARNINFDWIDLAMWKSFDSWSSKYVKKLSEKYEMPVKVIQISSNTNSKEMNKAVDMAKELWVENITINPPRFTNWKSYRFISNNISSYKRQNPNIKFSIINPPKSSLFMLPIPEYHFNNIVDIIKKYKVYLWFDVANIDEQALEINFLRKISGFVPHIWVVYLSDKTKTWVWHVPLWDWSLKLPTILKKFKQHEYYWNFSLKLEIDKKDLADIEKVEQILKKCKLYYKENFEELVIS